MTCMLFEPASLDELDLQVIEQVGEYRTSLRYSLSAPRRWKGLLRRNLRARAMRGSNSIEGYDVSLSDAVALLADDEPMDSDQKSIAEVTGYRNAMTYVQQLANDPDFSMDETLVRSLHFMMLGHDLLKSPGRYRRAEIFVRDEDEDEVVYEGPDAGLVQPLMAELVARINAEDSLDDDTPAMVRAALAHLNLVMIHPFRDGNGRMARCLQTLILGRQEILEPEFSSIEEWLGRNTIAYYDVLSETGEGSWNPQNSAHAWIKFNLRAHHMQAQTVSSRVEESSTLWAVLESEARSAGLPDRVVSALWDAAMGFRVRRPVYEADLELEPATASRDLRQACSAGLLASRGQTRGRFYVRTERLQALYAQVRNVRPRVRDPYVVDDMSVLAPGHRRRRILVDAAH